MTNNKEYKCINGYPIPNDYTEQLNGMLQKLNQIVMLLSNQTPLPDNLQNTHNTLMNQSKKRVRKNNE